MMVVAGNGFQDNEDRMKWKGRCPVLGDQRPCCLYSVLLWCWCWWRWSWQEKEVLCKRARDRDHDVAGLGQMARSGGGDGCGTWSCCGGNLAGVFAQGIGVDNDGAVGADDDSDRSVGKGSSGSCGVDSAIDGDLRGWRWWVWWRLAAAAFSVDDDAGARVFPIDVGLRGAKDDH